MSYGRSKSIQRYIHTLEREILTVLFVEFRKKFESSLDDWKLYYDEKEPHFAMLPQPWNDKLTEFQKMIVLRCIHPDKVSLITPQLTVIYCTKGYSFSSSIC